ncbi:trichohyalin [Solea solea]|uniref:trichohyalin n=1 Tax=Solea solea TaxID=90069 RepID=UPI00272A32F9|nr:trichohyalin [Solea solea]
MDSSRSHGGADAEDTEELLYTDLNVSRSDFDPEPLRPDHCDLLLDAIDAQLGQLQVQTQKHQDIFKKPVCRDAALQWSQSPSKDTGLGSTMQTNDAPMSCLDLIHSPVTEQRLDCRRSPESQEETEDMSDVRTRIREDVESHREEVMWRLQGLLGDACKENTLTETRPPTDSICTEDFVRRFREEMVEVALPRSIVPQRDKEEDTERTEISDRDTRQSEQKGQSVCVVDGSSTPGKSTKETASVHYSLSKKTSQRRQELDDCPPHNFRGNVANINEKTPNGRDGRRWRPLIQSITGSDDSSTDTHTQEESEPQSTSVHSSTFGEEQKRSRKALHKKRQTYRLVCSVGDEDTDERTSETMQWMKMKERLNHLRQKCEREEETLRMKMTQFRDVELCLSELRQRRKHALQELERLSAEMNQMETEKQNMELFLEERRSECDSISCHVEELQMQRESFLIDIRDMEEELATLGQRKKSLRDGPFKEKENSVIVMSVLEREELERQLDHSKTALFAEQRRAREKLESMQESLEQTREELQRATESESSLRHSCARLQEKQTQKKEKIQALEARVGELQAERGQCQLRAVTLEKMLAQKELQLLTVQEQHGALQAERDGLKGALRHLKNQHCTAQREAREHTYQIMLKEDEVKKLQISLEQQREQAEKREEELHKDNSEKVHKAVEEERRRWEAERVEAVQVHCGRLEEKNRKSVERVKSELQQEKSKTLTLQHKVSELKKRMQELERDTCAQQREQESLLTVICKSLKEEHQAELLRLKKQTTQERRGTEVRLEQAVCVAEKEAGRLRVMLEDRESSYNRITAELEQQHRLWAQELRAECQHLHLLLEQSGAKLGPVPLPVSPTEAEALTSLRALREQLEHVITHLHQELHSQQLNTEQLRKHKERELGMQREQLRMENDQARDSLKERLIQEHIEELSSLTRTHVSEGGGGVAASLRKQLKAKDLELRQLQRSMSEWKEQTTARLACKFEEELTVELERCKTKLLRGRKTKIQGRERISEKAEGGEEMAPKAKETQNSIFCPSLHVVVDSAASRSPSDVASFKLLRFLQTRVKQLRLENQAYHWNPSPPHTVAVDLSGSYLSTIPQGQDSVSQVINQDLLK